MCNAGFGLRQAFVRPAITYAWRAGALHVRWQKTLIPYCSDYIDTQGRDVLGPDERGLERLFTHNVKLYNCAAGLCGTFPELQYEA